jgi:WD40 repeat protein
MCTGELPFKGEKPLTVLWALAVQDPVPPRQLNPEVPAALSDLIMRLLAKDPADRPQSAREVSEALGAIDLSEPRTAPRPARRPRRRAVAALAVALLVLLAVGGALYGPTLYRLVSNRGQVVIVIDADDPDVKVLIKDKEQSAILDPKADREVTLKAGDYQVELLEAQLGQRLSARELTLKRGDRQVVSVEWAPPGLVHTLVGHTDDIHAVRWCLDGTYVLSASGGRFEFGKWVRGSDFALRLWDAKTGREVGSLPDHTDKVLALAVSPDGKRAVSAGGDAGRDYQLRYWDLETRKLIRRFDQRHTERINDLAFAPDGKRVVSAGSDKTVRLWDVETGRVIATFQEGETQPVWSVDISRDGKRIITSNWDGLLRLWDIDTQKQTRKPVPTGHTNLHVIRFAPDGRHALTQAGKGKVMLVDLETGRTVRSFQCDAQSMGGVFSPDGRRILTVGQDPFIRLWDVATGQELWKSAGHTGDVLSVAFSPDGQFAASAGSDKTVRIWRLGDSASPGHGVKMFGD